MWINAMSRVARRKGITVSELLKQRREANANITYPSERVKNHSKKKDAFEGLSTRDLYCRRPMD
jgi:hypothetical protein